MIKPMKKRIRFSGRKVSLPTPVEKKASAERSEFVVAGGKEGKSIGAFADEWQRWQIRMGLSPNSNTPLSLSGIYTDFA